MVPDTEAAADLGDDPSDWPEVAIIVLNWNNYEDTAECLESLEDLEYPNHEVIVVDNGSTDGSGKKLENEFEWCRFLFNDENLGFAAGNNVGIEYALKDGCPFVLLLNNDTVVESRFLEPLVISAERNKRRAIVSGLIYEYESSDLWYAGGTFSPTLVDGTFKQESRAQTEFEVGKITGALALIPREFIHNYNVLNEDYFIGLEDAELGWLARSKGWNLIVNPNSKILHKVNSSRGMNNPYTHYNATFNRLTFSSNHHSPLQKLLFFVYFSMTRMIRSIQWVLCRDWTLIYATFLGIYDFIMNRHPKDRQSLLNN